MRENFVCLPGFLQGAKDNFFFTVKQDKKNAMCSSRKYPYPPHPPPPHFPTGGNGNSERRGVQKETISKGVGQAVVYRGFFQEA